MLQSIYIQNYALIDKLDINFTSGFSVITGETGAGKSIILGAIGLLLGQRADVKAIKNGASKCIVEAHFHISNYGMESFFAENDIEYDPEECILRREVSINGKSRAFINDTPASLAQMKLLGEKLIDVHSQHQNLLLNKEGFQLNILDILAQDDRQLAQYQQVYTDYKQVCRELAGLPLRSGCYSRFRKGNRSIECSIPYRCSNRICRNGHHRYGSMVFCRRKAFHQSGRKFKTCVKERRS